MGAVAIRVSYDPGTKISKEFVTGLFALMPQGLMDTTVQDDIRISTRFHSKGIDIDLSSDHIYGAHDTSILRLAAFLETYFRNHHMSPNLHILRAGENIPVKPISSLPSR